MFNRAKQCLPNKIIKSLFYTLIDSHLNYGCIIWGDDENSLSQLKVCIIKP